MRIFRTDPDSGEPNGSNCGGTLVASKYVITAAHCVAVESGSSVAMPANTVAIRIGDHDLDNSGEEMITPKFVNVKAITIHPWYSGYISGGYDISILQLEEELDLGIYTPACLAKSDDATTFDGKVATVAGWGQDENGHRPDPFVPSEAAVPVMEAGECNGDPITAGSILCTGHEGLGNSAFHVMTYF